MGNRLYIVVPCYNEQDIIESTASKLLMKMEELAGDGSIAPNGKIVFVDDGSGDGTWNAINELCKHSKFYAGIKLSRNKGHQNALYAGLMIAKEEADFVISIDADLQDDINAINNMVQEYNNGCEIVYGVRNNRESDAFFKRATARCYYKLLRLARCDVIADHADFRLMSSRALDVLSEYGEQRLFLRGLVPMLGFKSSSVYYTRMARTAGKSKYPFARMMSLAIDGFMALSLRPLRLVTIIGSIMLLGAFALLLNVIVKHCCGQVVLDRAVLSLSIWAVGGIVTTSLGIVGEYIGRVLNEVKRRPRYVVERTVGICGAKESTEKED